MNRVLRLPELVEIATRPEIVAKMIAEFGPERTREILMVLRAKVEAWQPDEIEISDQRGRLTVKLP
jgi:hypothetical protein